jgi:6-phosphogluconolactonase
LTTQSHQFLIYIGTYTTGASEGIYVYRFDTSTGAMEHLSTTIGVENPSFLAIDPGGRYLYSVSKVADGSGQPTGAVYAFSIDQATGELAHLNHQSSGGAGPCHVSVDYTGRFVLVANYGSGSVAMLPIQSDGSLGEAAGFVQHGGSSVNPARQEGPHAHSIIVDPANRYAFAPDLGLDKVLIYRLDLDRGRLVPNNEPWGRTAPGAGPRHFDFHPNRKYAYVINELNSTFTAYGYDESNGALTEIQSISTLPEEFAGTNLCADVHVHPSGRFVYGSNRGHDSIVVCGIDQATGKLTYIDCESTQGRSPRNFALDPAGDFLLAANQDSDTVVTFRIAHETGGLEPTGHVAQVPTPVCLKLIPARR